MSMTLINFAISEPAIIDSIKFALGKSFARLKESIETLRFQIYDTFDWRLYHNDWELIRKGNRFSLFHSSAGTVIAGIDIAGKKERRFAWDFPASDFTDLLGPVLEMRALIPVAGIDKKVTRLAVCNADDKIVARIEIASLKLKGDDSCVTRLYLLPVKGYDKEAQRIIDILNGLNLPQKKASAVVELLRQSGIDPGAYSSKVTVSLQPEMPSSTAVQLILKNLVTVMHQNLEGVHGDIDTEFLHDLRVAIRRGRSLIGQTKGVFDEETTARLQNYLKTMGGVSGEVRDLDVYLLKKEAYVNKVPEALMPGVLELFRALQRKRRTARNRMLKLMGDTDFVSALAALDSFLQSNPTAQAGTAGVVHVKELATTVIYKRFRRIIRKGSHISADTPDEKLHELRIDCKKLRYLLEFFISLFPENEMKLLIKQLKGLQDNLGDFNDLSVQQDFLAAYLATITPQSSESVLMAAATGGLVTRLSSDHKRVRSEFLGVFKRFGSGKNKARFKALFN